MKTPRKPQAPPKAWREAMGIHPELEAAHSGHNRGVALLYAAMAVFVAAYIYGAWKGL